MSTRDLLFGLSHHALRLATFRGSVRSMPDSTGLTAITMTFSLIGGLFEQIARHHDLGMMLVIPFVWLPFVLLYAWHDGQLDRRLASGLFLVSVPIEMGMSVTSLVPELEWLIATWGAAVLIWAAATKDR